MRNKIHQRRRSRSDDIGTDHDIADIEPADRSIEGGVYNVIDRPPAFVEDRQ